MTPHSRSSALRHVRALLLIAPALAACGKGDAPKPKEPPEVGVVTVEARPLQQLEDLPGRTSAYLVSQVRARVDGIVLKRTFREGTDVKAGELLFKIDPAPYQAALASAQATLLRAQANLATAKALAERNKILVEGNAVSKQEYDNAVAAAGQAAADVASGEAAVKLATINLGYTDVTAPVTGRIGTAAVTEGAYVQASAATLMATVQKIDPMYVDLTQSSIAGLRLRREVASGQLKLNGPDQVKVALNLEDGTHYPHEGKLQFTDITVDQGTGTVTVRAIFPNSERVLLPGMFVRAQVDEGVNEEGLLVPQVAITHDAKGQPTALVVDADNKVVIRTLVTGRTMGPDWVVQSGLKVKDRVIVEGLQKIQPGQTVKPIPATAPQGRSASAGVVTGPAAKQQKGASAAQESNPAH